MDKTDYFDSDFPIFELPKIELFDIRKLLPDVEEHMTGMDENLYFKLDLSIES